MCLKVHLFLPFLLETIHNQVFFRKLCNISTTTVRGHIFFAKSVQNQRFSQLIFAPSFKKRGQKSHETVPLRHNRETPIEKQGPKWKQIF